MLLLLLSMVLM